MTSTMMKSAALVLSFVAMTISAPLQANANTDALARLRALNAQISQINEKLKNGPPLAYLEFCNKNRRECKAGGASSVSYNKKLLDTLYAVNRDVNQRIRYRAEKGDTWSINTRVGDCEDYALTKRSELIRAGVDASALRVAVVKTRQGIAHAVLVVKTSRGDLVLDNRRSSIRTRQKTGYVYEKMASSNPRVWVSMR